MNAAGVALLVIVLVLAAFAAFYYLAPQGQQGVGVSGEEINNLASVSPELNMPSDIGAEDNLPSPEDVTVVDENDVVMDLPENI